MLTIFALDDSEQFCQLFEAALQGELSRIGQHAVLHIVQSPSAMETQMQLWNPDICFLDVELGEELPSGIAIAKKIRMRYAHCQIIFLTNYLHYVTDSFGVQPVYYILKTELKQRLPEALSQALKGLTDAREAVLELTAGRKRISLYQEAILYLEHRQRTTAVVSLDRTDVTREQLSAIAARLDSRFFCQCHYSFVVNLRWVQDMGERVFRMENGVLVPISRANCAAARASFSRLLAGEIRRGILV